MLLRSGSKGEEVHDLQAELEVLGFYEPVFDSRTKKAVIAFQRSVSLVPDGVVGPRLLGLSMLLYVVGLRVVTARLPIPPL